ncbi:hypothetical protein PUR71_03640 [Streptomyces sp. SP17BM10]|uniref:hypothetical protein n=1 Tax=Streptomyces sp. SP17BM10 TaxID=3002530 RepID=UPI002E79F359|nr:hypothetical protein [Streptomyces sp. SP17BM10]MEE1782029.1 hypothetical protein [Streptomyces sp. SP17BM10]
MTRGKLWGYVASGARVLGAFGGSDGHGRSGGFGRYGALPRPGQFGRPGGFGRLGGSRGEGAGGREGAGGTLHPGAMAGPRTLSRPELVRLAWTDRRAGCEPQARHVQVAEVVRRVVRGGGRAAVVTVRVAPGLPVVVGDARRLEAALGGLVDHAVRRSPAGARVLVRADAVAAPALPGLGALGSGLGPGASGGPGGFGRARGRVEIRVSDRGAYELPEAREWLLAGVRPDGPVGPALHGLVLSSGGRVAVEATPGGGLTVVLILAVAND